MTQRLFGNDGFGTLSAAITNVATSVVLQAGEGAGFPSLTPGHHFNATIAPPKAESPYEIVKCTAIATDTFTIERAKEGTTAVAWPAGSRLEIRLTKEGIDYIARPFAERQIGMFHPGVGSAGPLGVDFGNTTLLGTWASYNAVAGGTLAAAQRGHTATASALANTGGAGFAGDAVSGVSRGSAAQHGGFFLRFRWVPVDVVAGNRFFFGLTTVNTVCAAGGATEPSVNGTDIFGLVADSGDTNVTIASRTASGATTKTALATPISFVSMVGKMYEGTVECEPGVVSSFKFKLVEWNGDTRTVLHDGTISATIPAADVLMRIHWGFGQGTDASVLRVHRFCKGYFEYSNPI